MDADPRVAMVEVCHLLAAQNLTSATGGNVSVRVGDGSYWVTPSRLHKSRMRVEDLVRVDGDFRVLEGARKPSSESLMHLAVYRRLPQAGAVVHAHPPVCGGFALAGKEMDTGSSSEAVAILGPRVPLIGYARPSTAELAELVGRSMAGNIRAYLMANHGASPGGRICGMRTTCSIRWRISPGAWLRRWRWAGRCRWMRARDGGWRKRRGDKSV